TNDLDQREAGGEFFKWRIAVTFCIAAQRPRQLSVRRATCSIAVRGRKIVRPRRSGTALIVWITFRQPIEARIRCDAGGELAVLLARPLQKNLRRRSARAPHFGRAGAMAHGTAAGGALEQLLGSQCEL